VRGPPGGLAPADEAEQEQQQDRAQGRDHQAPDHAAELDAHAAGEEAPDQRAHDAYGQDEVRERHRHRYEFNNAYRERLEEWGLVASGTSPDGSLVEVCEIRDHPFMVGTQYHPEFRSRPDRPHPLFRELIRNAKDRSSHTRQETGVEQPVVAT